MWNAIKNLFGKSNTAEEAFNRFILPEVERAREAGISEDDIDSMVREAISVSNGSTRFPGIELRNRIDTYLNQSK